MCSETDSGSEPTLADDSQTDNTSAIVGGVVTVVAVLLIVVGVVITIYLVLRHKRSGEM